MYNLYLSPFPPHSPTNWVTVSLMLPPREVIPSGSYSSIIRIYRSIRPWCTWSFFPYQVGYYEKQSYPSTIPYTPWSWPELDHYFEGISITGLFPHPSVRPFLPSLLILSTVYRILSYTWKSIEKNTIISFILSFSKQYININIYALNKKSHETPYFSPLSPQPGNHPDNIIFNDMIVQGLSPFNGCFKWMWRHSKLWFLNNLWRPHNNRY